MYLVSAQKLFFLVFTRYWRTVPYFSFPSLSPCYFVLLWLHEHSRLYSLLSNEKNSSTRPDPVWDPFSDNWAFCSGWVRKWEKDEEKERQRGWEGEREGSSFPRLQGPSDCITLWASKRDRGKKGEMCECEGGRAVTEATKDSWGEIKGEKNGGKENVQRSSGHRAHVNYCMSFLTN